MSLRLLELLGVIVISSSCSSPFSCSPTPQESG
jgi:hypothetical protein